MILAFLASRTPLNCKPAAYVRHLSEGGRSATYGSFHGSRRYAASVAES